MMNGVVLIFAFVVVGVGEDSTVGGVLCFYVQCGMMGSFGDMKCGESMLLVFLLCHHDSKC